MSDESTWGFWRILFCPILIPYRWVRRRLFGPPPQDMFDTDVLRDLLGNIDQRQDRVYTAMAQLQEAFSGFGNLMLSTIFPEDENTDDAIAPIPGRDAHWIGYCPTCGESELIASVGGLRQRDTIVYCYGCGTRRTDPVVLSEQDVRRAINHSRGHWRNYEPLPYDWHTLPEERKMELLKRKEKT